ncbi:MAG: putative addiction module antidote protein [Legionellales bacterium]|nr:MAG: putative addiction module antidote protein [Legionellales bacterium]
MKNKNITISKINQITDSYQDYLLDDLQDKESAAAYIQAALEEFQENGKTEILLLALRNVAKARGGIAKLAKKTHLNRESLYKTLSSKGNPKLNTLIMLLHALGFKLSIQTIKPLIDDPY